MLRLLIRPTPRSLSPTWPVKKHMDWFAILKRMWMGKGRSEKKREREIQVEGLTFLIRSAIVLFLLSLSLPIVLRQSWSPCQAILQLSNEMSDKWVRQQCVVIHPYPRHLLWTMCRHVCCPDLMGKLKSDEVIIICLQSELWYLLREPPVIAVNGFARLTAEKARQKEGHYVHVGDLLIMRWELIPTTAEWW